MRRVFQIIISLVLLGAAVAGGIVFVWPSYQELSRTRQLIEEYQDRVQRGEQALERLRLIQENIENRQEEFDKISVAIPEDKKTPAVFESLQQMAAASGLVLMEVEEIERAQPDQEMAPETGLELQLQGSYDGLKNFLEAARRSPRIVNLENITIEPLGLEESEGLGFTVQFIAYTQPEESS